MNENKIHYKNILKNPVFIGLVIGGVILMFGTFLFLALKSSNEMKGFAVISKKTFSDMQNYKPKLQEGESALSAQNRIEKTQNNFDIIASSYKEESHPAKGNSLHDNINEFSTLTKELITETLVVLDWYTEIEKVNKQVASFNGASLLVAENPAASLELLKASIDTSILRLENQKVPAKLKTVHGDYLKNLKKLTLSYAQLIEALKTNKIDSTVTLSTEITSLNTLLLGLPKADKIVADQNVELTNKISSLESEITAELDKY